MLSKTLYLYSYARNSMGAKGLAKHLLIKRIRHTDSRFRGKPWKIVLNWGCARLPYQASLCKVINLPHAVVDVANKLTFFEKLYGKGLTPAFTTDINKAARWIKKGKAVVCRALLRASSGRGIVIARKMEDLIPAPLYVRYVPKKDEYRVHIFDGRVIDVQKKMVKTGEEGVNYQVRNYNNGFIYGREGINPSLGVISVALEVFDEFDLDFGAVDVIWTENTDNALALEINTAPGLEGQTVKLYADVLKARLNYNF
jgi:hypothetical protein